MGKRPKKVHIYTLVLKDTTNLLKSLQKKCLRRSSTLEAKEEELRYLLHESAPAYQKWTQETCGDLLNVLHQIEEETERLLDQIHEAYNRSIDEDEPIHQTFEDIRKRDQGREEFEAFRNKAFEKSEEEILNEPLPKWTEEMKAFANSIFDTYFEHPRKNRKVLEAERILFRDALLHFMSKKPIPEASQKVWKFYTDTVEENIKARARNEKIFEEAFKHFEKDEESEIRTDAKDSDKMKIKSLYRTLSRALHPDLNPNQPEAHQKIWHLVQEAYQFGCLETLLTLELQLKEKEMRYESITQVSLLTSMLTRMDTRLRRVRSEIKKCSKEDFFEFEFMSSQARKKYAKKLRSEIEAEIRYARQKLETIKRDTPKKKKHNSPVARSFIRF